MAIGKQGRAIHRQGIKIRGQLIIYRPSSLPERDEDLGGRKGGRDGRGKGEGDPMRFSDPRGLDSISWLPVGNTAPRQDWASAPESQDALSLHQDTHGHAHGLAGSRGPHPSPPAPSFSVLLLLPMLAAAPSSLHPGPGTERACGKGEKGLHPGVRHMWI